MYYHGTLTGGPVCAADGGPAEGVARHRCQLDPHNNSKHQCDCGWKWDTSLDNEPHINVVASGYDVGCSCDENGEFTLEHVQLDEFDRDEHGLWVWTCPKCNHEYHFDGGDVEHSY